jgi:hypothetical protein
MITEKKWLPINPCRACSKTPSVTACFLCHPKEEFVHDVTLQKELLEHLLRLDCYEELLPRKIEEMIKQLEENK